MFLSPTHWSRSKKVQSATAVILLLIVLGWVIYTEITRPNVDSVNGVYRNECCGDIILRDGHISYRGDSLTFHLANMKFGLTGFTNGRFTRNGITESDEETMLLFSGEGGHRSFFVPIEGRGYAFRLLQISGPSQ